MTWVQEFGATSGAAPSLDIPVPVGGIPAGHTLFLGVAIRDSTSVDSITDTQGNTWTLHMGDNIGATSTRGALASCSVVNALSQGDVITVTDSGGSAQRWAASVQEFDDLVTSVDDIQNFDNAGNSSASLSAGTVTTNDTSALVVCVYALLNSGRAFTPGDGYTAGTKQVSAGGGGERAAVMQWKYVTGPGSFTTEATLNSSGTWTGISGAFGLDSPGTSDPPVADAGADQVVLVGDTVHLDATGSTDDEGIASYSWTQVSGTPVTLSGETTATPSFTAPDHFAHLVFEVEVTDDDSQTDTDQVTITSAVVSAVVDGQRIPRSSYSVIVDEQKKEVTGVYVISDGVKVPVEVSGGDLIADESSYPMYVAHRGGAGTHPQNTITAFTAYQDGWDIGWETDLQVLNDGTLALHHDDTLTFDGNPGIAVSSLSPAQWSTVEIAWPPGFSGPTTYAATLDEMLAVAEPNRILWIEPKAEAAVQPLLDLLENWDLRRRTVVTTFFWDRAQAFAAAGVHTCYMNNSPNMAEISAAGVEFVGVDQNAPLTQGHILDAHAAGLKIMGYTINNAATGEGWIASGLDVLVTNFPGRYSAIVPN